MRAEIAGVLTPEQRARMPEGGGRGMGMGMRSGEMGDMQPGQMGPPQNDIYARPGGMMRRRAEAMMRTQPNRGGRTIIIMTPREMRQMMRTRGGKGMKVPPKQAVKGKKSGGGQAG
jgi:hypothetical protein